MPSYTVQAAKTHLSRLLRQVENGEEISITRGDKPVARLVPAAPVPRREFGFLPLEVPDDFDDPLPDEELARWE